MDQATACGEANASTLSVASRQSRHANSEGDEPSHLIRRRRGRPAMYPERIPRLDPTIAADARIGQVEFTSAATEARRAADKRRLDDQCRVVREKSRQRATQQLLQLQCAADHVRAVADRKISRYHELADRQQQFENEVAQWSNRLLASEVQIEDVPERVRKALVPRKAHIDDQEDRLIHALDGSRSQKEIAREVGCSQSTVSRHLNEVSNAHDGIPRGARRKLSDVQLDAAARFMFVCPGSTLALAKKFLKLSYDVDVSEKTLSRHLRDRVGFRLGDFKSFHIRRNAQETIDKRFEYVIRLESEEYRGIFGPNPLYDAIYYDEMPLRRIANRKIWSVRGWVPSISEDPAGGHHVSLLLAVSPAIGVVWYEVLDTSIDRDVFLAFCNNMVSSYLKASYGSRRRLFILDNARFHRASCVESFFSGDLVANLFQLEFLPEYSPFLNPCEELFGLVKVRIWLRWVAASSDERSLASNKQALVEEVRRVTNDDIRQTYDHMREFLAYCKDRRPVYTQKLYESAHHGDDETFCPTGTLDVDDLLNSYLPHFYEEYTPDHCQHLRDVFGCSRLTKDFIENWYGAQTQTSSSGPGDDNDNAPQGPPGEPAIDYHPPLA